MLNKITQPACFFLVSVLGIQLCAGFSIADESASKKLITVEVPVLQDAGVVQIQSAPNNGGGSTFLLSDRASGEFDHNYMRFDLSVLPAGVSIEEAYLELSINTFENHLSKHVIELGRVEEGWSEGDHIVAGSVVMEGIAASNEPMVTWLESTETVFQYRDAVRIPVQQVLQDWVYPTGTGSRRAPNILRNSALGLLIDVANQDKGDDGWLNRNARFEHCSSEVFRVRIRRDEDANVLDTMYLNAWFDGNRDGDWADQGPCVAWWRCTDGRIWRQ